MPQDDVYEQGEEPGFKANRDSIFAAMTGRTGSAVSGAAGVTGMLRGLVGTSRRTGEVDTKAAAAALGVSRRRVQAWLKAEREGQPAPLKAATKEKISTKSRQRSTTKRGRSTALRDARARPPRSRTTQVRVSGNQGPRAAGKSYARSRTTPAELSPEQYEQMLDAYEAGGDKGVASFLEGVFDEQYRDDWGFFEIDAIEFN